MIHASDKMWIKLMRMERMRCPRFWNEESNKPKERQNECCESLLSHGHGLTNGICWHRIYSSFFFVCRSSKSILTLIRLWLTIRLGFRATMTNTNWLHSSVFEIHLTHRNTWHNIQFTLGKNCSKQSKQQQQQQQSTKCRNFGIIRLKNYGCEIHCGRCISTLKQK